MLSEGSSPPQWIEKAAVVQHLLYFNLMIHANMTIDTVHLYNLLGKIKLLCFLQPGVKSIRNPMLLPTDRVMLATDRMMLANSPGTLSGAWRRSKAKQCVMKRLAHSYPWPFILIQHTGRGMKEKKPLLLILKAFRLKENPTGWEVVWTAKVLRQSCYKIYTNKTIVYFKYG